MFVPPGLMVAGYILVATGHVSRGWTNIITEALKDRLVHYIVVVE